MADGRALRREAEILFFLVAPGHVTSGNFSQDLWKITIWSGYIMIYHQYHGYTDIHLLNLERAQTRYEVDLAN